MLKLQSSSNGAIHPATPLSSDSSMEEFKPSSWAQKGGVTAICYPYSNQHSSIRVECGPGVH